jgi:hypothetical protein
MAHHKDLMGRDAYVIVEALTFTIEALSGLPIEHRPENNIADMKRLIDDFVKQDATLSVSQSIAHNRLANGLNYSVKPRSL